jgi:hypothetical protein
MRRPSPVITADVRRHAPASARRTSLVEKVHECRPPPQRQRLDPQVRRTRSGHDPKRTPRQTACQDRQPPRYLPRRYPDVNAGRKSALAHRPVIKNSRVDQPSAVYGQAGSASRSPRSPDRGLDAHHQPAAPADGRWLGDGGMRALLDQDPTRYRRELPRFNACRQAEDVTDDYPGS